MSDAICCTKIPEWYHCWDQYPCGVREEYEHLEDDVSFLQAAVLGSEACSRHLLDEDLTAQTQTVLYTTGHTNHATSQCARLRVWLCRRALLCCVRYVDMSLY